MSTEHSGHGVDDHQVEDAPLRRSEEEADETNPDVHHHPQDKRDEPEAAESYERWEKDEQRNERSRN